MRRLNAVLRTRLGLLRESDTGATIVFVAVILVALLAMSAFAIDFGRMWEERRQLQNGADAAAVAIAEDCARGLCDALYDEYAVADIYVDANARDGAAWPWNVELDLVAQTVTVHNATEDPGGDNKFDMLLAGAVGFDGFTVGAQATVAWGNALQIATIPIIISECEWERSASDPWGGAGGGDDLWPEADIDYNTTPYHTMIFHIGSGDAEDEPDSCIAPAGGDVEEGEDPTYLHGGFGYLAAGDDCDATVYGVIDEDDQDYDPANPEYGWVKSATGNDHPDCNDDQIAALVLDLEENIGKTVFVPYFDRIWNHQDDDPPSPCDNPLPGNDNKCYHIAGYGAFHVVGYKFGGASPSQDWTNILVPPVNPPLTKSGTPWPESQWDNKFRCLPGGNSSVSCLLGYFTDTVYSGPADIGGGDRGITVIKFTG